MTCQVWCEEHLGPGGGALLLSVLRISRPGLRAFFLLAQRISGVLGPAASRRACGFRLMTDGGESVATRAAQPCAGIITVVTAELRSPSEHRKFTARKAIGMGRLCEPPASHIVRLQFFSETSHHRCGRTGNKRHVTGPWDTHLALSCHPHHRSTYSLSQRGNSSLSPTSFSDPGPGDGRQACASSRIHRRGT